MPEGDAGEKTEEATPRKREKAREEGQTAFSAEVNSAGLLLVGFAVMLILGPLFWYRGGAMMRFCFSDGLLVELDTPRTMGLMWTVQQPVLSLLGAFLLLAFVIAGILAVSQVGLKISPKALQPKMTRISPLSGVKRIFGLRGLMRFVFSVLKLTIIVVIAWLMVQHGVMGQVHYGFNLEASVIEMAYLMFKVGITLSAVLALIAALDFMYQRFQHDKDLRMSKQEVKEEMKQADGDPLVKQRIRQIQREMAQQRMMQEVPNADVVITNPTHVAVALKYNAEEMAAPVVVAKGYDNIAQRIKAIAAEHNVAMVENVPLARALAKQVELGHAIPVEHYQAVAEVLSMVYKLKNAS